MKPRPLRSAPVASTLNSCASAGVDKNAAGSMPLRWALYVIGSLESHRSMVEFVCE